MPRRLSGPFLLATWFAALAASTGGAAETILELGGTWRYELDRADVGIGERWFERELPGRLRLPGSLPAQGIGDEVTVETQWTGGIVDRSWFTAPEYSRYRQPGNVKVPFWLQPERYYAGIAWFQRDVEIPEYWKEKSLVLSLERPHWETRVWLDGRFLGAQQSLFTPHEYDLGRLAPGKHVISIRVDNRRIVDIGENSHGISDHTQGNWNGIVGRIHIRARPAVRVDELQVYPSLAKGTVRIRGRIASATGRPGKGTIVVRAREAIEGRTPMEAASAEVPCEWEAEGGFFECELPVRLPEPWDEFHPALYRAEAWVEGHEDPAEAKAAAFGFRDISIDGTQIAINGRKTFIRGTLECCIFPKSGHPPMEREEWRRVIRVAKSYGLNLFRFHSWCAPEAAFQAADELGFYFQVETCWPNQSTTLGDGKPVDTWVYEETDRILRYYGNHPSFILMVHGNEPGGRNAGAWLAKYLEHFKAKDPRRLWSGGSGWPQLAEDQFHVTPDPRIQAWGGGLGSRINARPPETMTDYRDYVAARKVPVISHEIGQWCVYPNFDEIPKYTGHLKPKNFEIFRDLLTERGMVGLAKQFLLASGKLQTLCYKEEIESALRTPGMAGFQLLDLHDFPGQGTALVGVLDPFWEEKGYVTAGEYRRFSNSTVPLARLRKRVFTTEEDLEAEIEVAHFGAEPLKNVSAAWRLADSAGRAVAEGKWASRDVPIGNGISLGRVVVDLERVPAPARCKLVVRIEEVRSAAGSGNGASSARGFENDWDLWVYPARPAIEPAGDILITAEFDGAAERHLASGGKLLLTVPGEAIRNFDDAPVKLGFSSIFWNTAWTGRQAPTTLGILCDPRHPALAQFPTEFHSNWQWWYIVHRAGALRLDLLPQGLEPIVRVIDDWFTARPLGLVVEGKVGAGRIIVCGFDLSDRALADPVSRQMRASLLAYMASRDFAPKADLTAEEVRSLFAAPKEARRE